MKLFLPNVTLLAVDTGDDLTETNIAVEICKRACDFGDVKVLTKKEVPQVKSYETYNLFMLYQLKDWFYTTHVLTIQQDGYIINPKAWTNDFLKYDYIGGPWIEDVCGNGGFSLRSRRLCQLLATVSPACYPYIQEDKNICQDVRFSLTREGMRFAPCDVASRFSYAKNSTYNRYLGSFGFHGRHSLLKTCVPNLECEDCKKGDCSHLECSACDLKEMAELLQIGMGL